MSVVTSESMPMFAQQVVQANNNENIVQHYRPSARPRLQNSLFKFRPFGGGRGYNLLGQSLGTFSENLDITFSQCHTNVAMELNPNKSALLDLCEQWIPLTKG